MHVSVSLFCPIRFITSFLLLDAILNGPQFDILTQASFMAHVQNTEYIKSHSASGSFILCLVYFISPLFRLGKAFLSFEASVMRIFNTGQMQRVEIQRSLEIVCHLTLGNNGR